MTAAGDLVDHVNRDRSDLARAARDAAIAARAIRGRRPGRTTYAVRYRVDGRDAVACAHVHAASAYDAARTVAAYRWDPAASGGPTRPASLVAVTRCAR